jgi:uncharacterized protein (DUF924 family)
MKDDGIEQASGVLDYWFGAPGSPEHGQRREIWFKDGRAIDAEIRERFLDLHEKAASGGLDHWRQDPRACLALILLLDQFPRHMFRDRPRAYATDPKALATATHALDAQFDRDRPLVEVNFFYLPFSHAEQLAAQHRSVEFRRALPEHKEKEKSITHAVEHMEVIARFGRFPHRNEILGRESTPEEARFITEDPDAWFVKYLKKTETDS